MKLGHLMPESLLPNSPPEGRHLQKSVLSQIASLPKGLCATDVTASICQLRFITLEM